MTEWKNQIPATRIRFGKCYVLGQIRDYKNFTKEIVKTVEYSNTIKNNWYWSPNKRPDDAEDFMLGSVLTYLKQLYDTEDDSLLENIKQIGDVTLQHYPDNIEILSTTAVAHMLTGQYDGQAKHQARKNINELKNR